MRSIHLIAPPQCAARLADALQACGIANDGGRAVVVASLAKADAEAAAKMLETLGDDAIVAASAPARFPFVDALAARAEEMWRRPPLLLPPLNAPEDFARAAQTIAAALETEQSGESEEEFAATTSPAAAVAEARRALDGVL